MVFLLSTLMVFAQSTIRGVVSDDTGTLPGVSVKVKGTTLGTQTNENGEFTLKVTQGATLVITSIGYGVKEVTVGTDPNIRIVLSKNTAQLDEVVVTSFGIKKEQRALGYATSTVTSKELTEAGNTNFASALYGKAPGVRIATAPGGASSAVNVQIRGINSLNYNQPPLFVVDGVIVRNFGQTGAAGINNGGFFDDQRIRGNGVLDINPQDIESLTVLRGASATALYGSDALSGVIVITTKKGSKSKGLGVDFNYFGTVESVAFAPQFQNVYGQGYDRATNLAVGANANGFFTDALSPSGSRPNFRAYANFGPKMEGQQVRWWDGSIQSYSPQPDNYNNIYRNGYSSIASVAVSSASENLNFRISANRLDYSSIQRASDLKKNTFSFNGTAKLNKALSVDLVANYVNTLTHNRPYQINRLVASYDGFFGRSEHMDLALDNYQTSQGYSWVPFNQTARNPQEAFVFNVRPNLFDYFYTTLKNTTDENENRLYSSATLNWNIVNHLKLRGRVGNDYTSLSNNFKNYNQYPVAFNAGTSSTGAYGTSTGTYATLYGDGLLTYDNVIGKDFTYSVSGGFTSRTERYLDESSSTNNGLVTENFFSISNSNGIAGTSSIRKKLLKYGFFGIANFSYKNYLFLEATARQESSSTLPVQNNSYFYPSVNTGFVFTDALLNKPSFYSYGKLRASYGEVGNSAPIYAANVLYQQNSLQTINGPVAQLSLNSDYGNLNLRPERKKEFEFGIENKFLNNRVGFDLTYYNNRIKDVILQLQIAPSNGANRQIVNTGEIGNYGWELAFNGTPFIGNFKWTTRLNFAFNKSKVYSLATGTERIPFVSQQGNAIYIEARAGQEIGNIYVNPLKTGANGQKLVDEDGYYVPDNTRYEIGGNVLPKVSGGLSNTFSFKGFSLDVLVDYRLGGQIISSPLKYGIGTGQYESTLQYRDAEHGGLRYYELNGNRTLLGNGASAPAGATVYNDGLILPGVKADGTPNDVILDAAAYYFNAYTDGNTSLNQKNATIFDNSYVKMREMVFGYTLPNSLTSKIKMNNVRLSLIGRNLFYIYRTLKNLDPEAMIGNQWYSQGVDNGSIAATRSFGLSLNASF